MPYAIARFDDSADGMEPLRCQSECILLASGGADATAESVQAEFCDDLQTVARPDGFDYDAARAAIVEWFADGGAAVVERSLAQWEAIERREAEESGDNPDEWQGFTLRLYLDCGAPELAG